MATTTFPTDQQLPNTNKIIRQTDCQYSFGKEAVNLTLKFMGDTKEAVGLAAAYRSGTRVKVSDLTSKFAELTGILPTSQLEATGKVTASVSSTRTGSGSVSITVQVPYKAKISIGGSGGSDDPEKRVIVTWSEKSTDYEFPLEIYAGESQSASEANAGDLEAWKNEKTKNIENYKNFKYTVKNEKGEDVEVELQNRTRALAEKFYKGIESVRRAYPEVIRTTQYLNLKADKDEVDETLIKQIDPKTGGVKLYYRDQTPNSIWKGKFPNFDWLYASYDVNTEVTEYQRLWNVTVSESWIGIDKDERGTWDDDLYGPDGTRWKFAGVNGVQPSGSYDDDTPIEPEDVSGKGRVKPDTFTDQSSIKDIDLGGDFHAVDSNSFRAASTRGLRLLAATPTPGAPALESIKMPSVSFIGDDAFNGAANLQSIVLSNQISFLGESVFKDCSAMTEAIVEPSIYELPASTFEGCSALDGSQGGAFTVGGLVNTLGEYAFKDCTALTAINCTNALTSIGANAFENDDALTSFTMGLNSTGSITIGDEAFKGCEKLADIELPVPTITLGTDSFLNAFASEVTVKAPKSFLANLPNTSSYTYIYPAFVDTIAQDEWRDDTRLLGAVVCDAITSIPVQAFRGCSNCTSITLPDTVTSIGHDAFRNSGITSFTMPPLLTGTLNYQAFYQCTALETFDFNNITVVGNDCFSGASSLNELLNADKLTTIGQRALMGTAIVTFDGGEDLTSISASAFKNCTALKSFIMPENETGSLSIGNTAFEGDTALERIEIPVGGTLTIGTTIFNNALANEIWLKAPFNSNLVGSIPSGKLVNYIYPSFTTSIASGEFRGNTALKSVAIPGGVTSIGTNSFRYCGNLSSVTLAEGLTSISEGMFQECNSLTSIDLPSTITSIGTNAFRSSTGLTGMDIPAAVTSIGADVFKYCSGITAITMEEKDISTVQGMTNYPFGLTTGQVIHCSDGDITI